MASALDTRKVEYVLSRKKAAQALRQVHEPTWYRMWELFRNKGQTRRVRGQQWESNAEIGDGFRLIMSLTPQHVRGTLRNYGWFWLTAGSVEGHEYEEVVKAKLLSDFRRARGPMMLMECIQYCNTLGTVVTKMTWETELGEREVPDVAFEYTESGEEVTPRYMRRTEPYVRHNGPKIWRPSLFHVWIDPTGNERFFIERKYESLEFLKTVNKQFGGRLYKGLDELRNADKNAEHIVGQSAVSIAEAMMGGGGVMDTPDLLQQVDGIPENIGAPGDTVDLLQFWGWVPPSLQTYDDTQWRLMVIGNESVLLRDVPAPTPDHRPPYIVTPATIVPGSVYGETPLAIVEPLLKLKSFIENARRDDILLNLHQQWLIDREARITGADMANVPGGAMFVNNYRGQLNQVMMPVPRQPVLPEAYNEAMIKEEQSNRISGVTEHMKGEGLGSRATAMEAGIVNHSGSARVEMSIMLVDEMLKRPWLERMFRYNQTRLDQPEWVQLAYDDRVRYKVSLWDLQQDVDIYVDSGLFGGFNNSQVNTLIQLYQMFSQDPETGMALRKPQIARDLLYLAGMPASHRHVKSDMEIQDEQRKLQEQAQQQMALEASLKGQAGSSGGAR